MSITLKDGTVLPDIPVLAEYEIPDNFTFETVIEGTSYVLVLAPGELVYVENETTIFGSAAGYAVFACNPGETRWRMQAGELDSPISHPLEDWYGDGNYYSVAWSNHDIRKGTLEGDAGVPGTEIYFPNSTIFRLPDGTELPALPVGCFEKGAYGAVLKMVDSGVEAYVFGVATQGGIYVPAEIAGGEYNLIHSTVEGEAYVYVPGTYSDWQYTGAGSFNDPLIEGFLELKWSNFDILTATAKNDDGTYEIGTDIYRPSDVNYRIYGGLMQSLANEARRLGGVTGAMKPDVVESTLRGVTAGGGGGDVPNAEGVLF